MFNSLTNMKRSSEASERRASQEEMAGSGGMMSGWFNQTFKGAQKPAGNVQKDNTKRGVME